MDDTEKLKAIEAKLRESGFENVEGLLEDRTKTKGELDSVKSQMSNAQETIQRQGNELGELRKSVKELEAEKAARDATGSNENGGGIITQTESPARGLMIRRRKKLSNR